MDFSEATDRLMDCNGLADVAKACGVSHALVRQARLDAENQSYRKPPSGWEKAVAKLARKRARELEVLAGELARGTERDG